MIISDLNPVDSDVTSAATKSLELGRTDFLRMLVAQLENQDPLNPQDGTQFTAQLAQFSQLEQLIAVRTSIDELVASLTGQQGSEVDRLTSGLLSAGLIGRDVLYAGNEFSVEPSVEGGAAPEDIRLAYDLYGNTTNTTLRILNESGIEVATLDRGRNDLGQYEVRWDGVLEDGSRLAPGTYHFEVDARLAETPVDSASFVGGRVTGTNLTGDSPILLVGKLKVPIDRVLEVSDERGRR